MRSLVILSLSHLWTVQCENFGLCLIAADIPSVYIPYFADLQFLSMGVVFYVYVYVIEDVMNVFEKALITC